MQFNQIEPLYSFLSKEISTKEMPIKLSYKFSKLLTSVNTEFEFYQKKVSEILQKYGQKDDKGEFIIKDGSSKFLQLTFLIILKVGKSIDFATFFLIFFDVFLRH